MLLTCADDRGVAIADLPGLPDKDAALELVMMLWKAGLVVVAKGAAAAAAAAAAEKGDKGKKNKGGDKGEGENPKKKQKK
jgi:ribosomal protein L12E/L44/L45/RPP1/RPP2